MKKKRLTQEQIIDILRQADAWLKPGELAREHGMDVNEIHRLRTLEEENRRLKTLVADL